MEWISVKDKWPPRDRNLLIADDKQWVFVGSHKRNTIRIELPHPDAKYAKNDERRILESAIFQIQRALNPFEFSVVTFDSCQGDCLFWSELPLTPKENPLIWNVMELIPNKPEDELSHLAVEYLLFHKKLGVIEAVDLDYSDTYSCKSHWKKEDISHWMYGPERPIGQTIIRCFSCGKEREVQYGEFSYCKECR